MPEVDQALNEFPVKREAKAPHGNTTTAAPFYKLKKGEAFRIPVEDYSRVNSARAHFQKKNPKMKFSSRSVRENEETGEGPIVGYIFRRDS
jgi:hypothetical protein